MSFPYQKVLIIGATSGIGKALATKFVEKGTKVIVAGRREENLNAFAQEHGRDYVKTKVVDIMQLDQVRSFHADGWCMETNCNRSLTLPPMSLLIAPTSTASL